MQILNGEKDQENEKEKVSPTKDAIPPQNGVKIDSGVMVEDEESAEKKNATSPRTVNVTSALELEMVQERLRQRDSEIRVLLRMLKQERKRASRAEFSMRAAGMEVEAVSPVSPDRLSPLRLAREVEEEREGVIAPVLAIKTTRNSMSLSSEPAALTATGSSRLGDSFSLSSEAHARVRRREEAHEGKGRDTAGNNRGAAGNDRGNGLLSQELGEGGGADKSSSSETLEWREALKAG